MGIVIFRWSSLDKGLFLCRSPCVNGVCVCPAQYTGNFCGFGKLFFFSFFESEYFDSLDNPCYHPICRNGGICSVISNTTTVSFTCTCPSLYTGQYCETPLNIQIGGNCSAKCLNGGSCVNGMCMCTEQYVGPSCQYGESQRKKINDLFLFI
jgi:hypothetical protein